MRKGNIDITFIIIIVLLAGSSLRSGGFSDPKEWLIDKILLLPGLLVVLLLLLLMLFLFLFFFLLQLQHLMMILSL